MALDFSSFIPSFGSMGTFIGIFGWVFVVAALGYLVWYFLSYNVHIMIYNEGRPTTKDKARLDRSKDDKSIRKLRLLKNKHDFMGTVPENHILPVLGAFSRVGYMIHMKRDVHGALYSIPPPMGEGFMLDVGIAPALREWTKIKTREAVQRYTQKNFWVEYAPLLISITGFIIIGVIMLVISRDLGTVAEAFNNAATAFRESVGQAALAEQVVG